MQSEDQTQTVRFLQAAEGPGQAARIDTHISIVILKGDRVFKLKRAVKLPYLDFSTPALRCAACRRELELNRRTAPALYLGVRTIHRDARGNLAFEGEGSPVDCVVEMKRFDQADIFDAMAGEGRLTAHVLNDLAGHIAAFHARAEIAHGISGAQALEAALVANEGGFAEATIFERGEVGEFLRRCRQGLESHRAVLDARARAGKVRRCHGDLHLRNICLYEGEPVLFDCLEFDEALARTDVLYDLAFLLMDLWHRDRRSEANVSFNRYIDATGDDAALALVPFFMAIRAGVRAHVGAAGAAAAGNDRDKIAEARAYLQLALDLLQPAPLRLVAIGGLSGSGKSSVAAGFAAAIGAPPGARILSTDRLRKQLANVKPTDRLPPQSYTPEASLRVYGEQRRQAAHLLESGWSVIADGAFLKPEERAQIAEVAGAAQARFDGLWLEAPADVLAARVGARVNDPSDATIDVARAQQGVDVGPMSWRRVDASGAQGQSVARALDALASQGD